MMNCSYFAVIFLVIKCVFRIIKYLDMNVREDKIEENS